MKDIRMRLDTMLFPLYKDEYPVALDPAYKIEPIK